MGDREFNHAARSRAQLLVFFVNTNVTYQATMLFTVQLWTRLGQSMRPASQQWSPFRLNSRSGARGISTNVALSKGGLLRYNGIYNGIYLPTFREGTHFIIKTVSFVSGGPYGPRGVFIWFVKCQYNLYVCIGYILPIIGRNMSVGGLGNMYIL